MSMGYTTNVRERRCVPSLYRKEFCDRVKRAREGVGISQTDMAELLQVDQGTYKQYEGDQGRRRRRGLLSDEPKPPRFTLMPHDLLPLFCALTGKDPWEMLTGQHPAMRPQVPSGPAALIRMRKGDQSWKELALRRGQKAA